MYDWPYSLRPPAASHTAANSSHPQQKRMPEAAWKVA